MYFNQKGDANGARGGVSGSGGSSANGAERAPGPAERSELGGVQGTPPSINDDAGVVRRCLEGDTAAFEALVVAYQRLAFTVAMRMLGDYEDARDATQTTFVKAFEKLASYEPRYRFFSWLYRILINECLNVRRGRHAREELSPDQPSDEGPRDAVEVAEQRRDVRIALLALPVYYREVIVLRHFAHMSYDEMSVALGLPVKTVKSRLHTARQQLTRLLSAWRAR